MNDMPSGPATGQRVLPASKRMNEPSRTRTSSPSTRQWPLPRITTETSSWSLAVSSCSLPSRFGGRSKRLIPKASTPSSRRTKRTAPPGPLGSMSSMCTREYAIAWAAYLLVHSRAVRGAIIRRRTTIREGSHGAGDGRLEGGGAQSATRKPLALGGGGHLDRPDGAVDGGEHQPAGHRRPGRPGRPAGVRLRHGRHPARVLHVRPPVPDLQPRRLGLRVRRCDARAPHGRARGLVRSEERRVGKEWRALWLANA